MKKVMGLVWGLIPVSAYAQCITPPDCATIGYTETSCEGDGLKCPFDTTKLYCPPCDSSFRYTCTGDNIKNPVGNTCNNKYAACECIDGATFTNGECLCDTSCATIGNIYYSDGTCSSCIDSNKTPVGIIVKPDELIISLQLVSGICWSRDYSDIGALNNYATAETALTDYSGFENTSIIVEHYGEDAADNVGVYCYNYAPEGFEESKNKWYMPAAGELFDYAYENLSEIKTTSNRLGINFYLGSWTSTECNKYSVWKLIGSTMQCGSKRQCNFALSCFLAI